MSQQFPIYITKYHDGAGFYSCIHCLSSIFYLYVFDFPEDFKYPKRMTVDCYICRYNLDYVWSVSDVLAFNIQYQTKTILI